METFSFSLELHCLLKVEREPMWDGNVPSYVKVISDFKVEREPMWDGNM